MQVEKILVAWMMRINHDASPDQACSVLHTSSRHTARRLVILLTYFAAMSPTVPARSHDNVHQKGIHVLRPLGSTHPPVRPPP